MMKTDLITSLAAHLLESGQVPTEEDLSEWTDSLVSFFEILIEADKKLMKTDESSNNRNPNTAD